MADLKQIQVGNTTYNIEPYTSYITLSTQQDNISGRKTFTGGVKISGRYQGSGDDEGLIIGRASNSYAGLCLGDPGGVRSVFYLNPSNSAFWRYNNGTASYDITHPGKAGTIALTSDINSAISGTTNYIPKFTAANTIGNGWQVRSNTTAHLEWTSQSTDTLYIPTINKLAYWNGRYNATSSNLTYCTQGYMVGTDNTTCTANGVPRFDGTGARKIKPSGVTINDNGLLTAQSVTLDTAGSLTTYKILHSGEVDDLEIGDPENAAYVKFVEDVQIGDMIIGVEDGRIGGIETICIGKSAQTLATGAVAIGKSSSATANSVSIGSTAFSNEQSVAIGTGSTACYSDTVVVGYAAYSGATGSVIVGNNAYGDAQGQTVIGGSAQATGTRVIAIGHSTTVSGAYSVGMGGNIVGGYNTAIGHSSLATGGSYNAVVGYNEDVYGANNAAIGTTTTVTGTGNAVVGYSTGTSGSYNVVLGCSARGSSSSYSVVVGYSAYAYNNYNIAIGCSAKAGNSSTARTGQIAIGYNAGATGGDNNTIVIGTSAVVNTTSGTNRECSHILIGGNAKASSYDSGDATWNYNKGQIAIGHYAQATGADACIAIGNGTSSYYPVASGNGCIAIGSADGWTQDTIQAARSYGSYSIAIGVGSQASNGGVAVGRQAVATASSSSTAVGNGAKAIGSYGTAVGNTAQATGSYSVAMGYSAKATGSYAIAIGYNTAASVSGSKGLIVIGTTTNNYRFFNGTATSWSSGSDIRDKTDIEPLCGGIDLVKQIQPILYRENPRDMYSDTHSLFDYDKEAHAKATKAGLSHRASFKAQEVAKYMEDNYGDESFNSIIEHERWYDDVTGEEEDRYFISYGDLMPFLFQAVKEQQEIIEEQQEKINKLEEKINEFLKRVG